MKQNEPGGAAGGADGLRAFIALPLSPELATEVERLQGRLRAGRGGEGVRWLGRDQLHLTLRFFGSMACSDVPRVSETLQVVSGAHRAFALGLEGLGCFPSARQPRVVWLGIGGEVESLRVLQAEVTQQTRGFGEPPEDRPFAPHLTIGRVKREVAPPAVLAEWSGKLPGAPLGTWQVREVVLMQSELAPTGARYTVLASAPLQG
jgi:2'-5' RNA ligase